MRQTEIRDYSQPIAQAGWVIDWSRIDFDLFAHAHTVAITSRQSRLDALICSALVTTRDARGGAAESRRRGVEARSGIPARAQTPTQLDRALHAAIERRRAHTSEREPPQPDPPTSEPPGRSL